MELTPVKLFHIHLKKFLKSAGLEIEKDDDKYLVARGLDHTVIYPKIKTDKFIRVMIVEYDSHIVKNITYTGYYFKTILEKFTKAYNRYIIAKQ